MGGQEFSYVPKIMNGGLAGIVGVTCVFPIDLVKTRLQNQPILPKRTGTVQRNVNRHRSAVVCLTGRPTVDCAKQTWRSGGASVFSKVRFFIIDLGKDPCLHMFHSFHSCCVNFDTLLLEQVHALYSGSAVNIVLITPEKAIKLVANDFFRHHLSVPGQKKLSAWRGMIAGGMAGMFQIIVTTPMELLKIQMQDQGRTAVPGQKKMTALELTTKLLRENGIAGLYKGLGSTFARDVTFSMMYFPLFAYLDSLGPRKSDGSGDAVFWTSFVAGLAAGASSSFAVTPLD
ncbi:hypothetical protein COOONC_02125, partial [Cooperia oncophora]